MRLDLSSALVRAAEYVRMSTDHQKYSTANQSVANRAYAAQRGMEIIRTYADEGRSGLTIYGRDALKQLISDVQSGRADFGAILVYDVSRWGRFQDVDESGYYEYICKRTGIGVHYCAEQFENDGSALAAIVKAVKRSMAAEYSRELSTKVFVGKSRLTEMGFYQGGPAGFGLRRLIVDQNGAPKSILQAGERKNIATDRVILTPGPPDEVAIIRWMFLSLVRDGKNEKEIADSLNSRGILNDRGRQWNHKVIRKILKSERYVGNNVWNRQSFKLQKVRVRNSPEMWLRADGAFEAIIEPSLFAAAQKAIRNTYVRRGMPRLYSDAEMLEALRQLLRRNGYLSSYMVDRDGIQTITTYKKRFGGLERTFRLVGFDIKKHRKKKGFRAPGPSGLSDEEMLAKLRQLLRKRGRLSQLLISKTKNNPSPAAYAYRFGTLSECYRRIGYVPKIPGNTKRRN